ncbi:tetratricopeptide repeat protein [Okeania sp. KiyG1]|uniref:tetratricopeptide repeat protein n=1 Tax=Okeania sp. KiyG1 TaxID=2720165 RepID=UPI001921AA05|nr:tetratricopeptide repeat protein [Okeania sp. KiyG1]GFZ91764.1 hypothetical protein CYANOKiyG1_02190 [Okeania sp. KiyG1]
MEQKISIVDLNQKAESYLAQGKLKEADATCNEVLAKIEDLALIFNTKGRIVAAMGNLELAEDYYQKAIAINPDFSPAHFNLGNLYSQQKQWNLATASYDKAIKLNPDDSWYYQKLGRALMELKEWKEAVNVYHIAIEINPNISIYYNNLGQALAKLKKWDEAVITYQKAIDIDPNNSWYYKNYWEALLKTNKWHEIAATYQQALEKNPDAYWYYYQLGYILHKQGLIDEAIAYYQKAKDFQSALALVHKDLGDALLEKRNSDEAIACYIKAIQLQPDLFAAYTKLRAIHRYQLVKLDQNQLNQLINCYQEAIKMKPEFSEHYLNLANILTQQGKIKEASSYYQKVLSTKLTRNRPEFVKKYGDFIGSGKPDFLIIGTVKGGTSSLYSYLIKHPSILPAVNKELHFFDLNFHQGIDWYSSQFPEIPKQYNFSTGEATPNYMYSLEAVNKVFNYFPKIKLIAILRNPIERAVSHYYMIKQQGTEKRSFEEVIAKEMKKLSKTTNQSQIINADFLRSIKPKYLSLGFYLYFIQEWMNIFPREQFLILKSEDMYENPAATTKKVFDFLGLPNHQLLDYKHYFSGSYSPINADIYCQLCELFQLHNQKLEEYLGMKFDWK